MLLLLPLQNLTKMVRFDEIFSIFQRILIKYVLAETRCLSNSFRNSFGSSFRNSFGILFGNPISTTRCLIETKFWHFSAIYCQLYKIHEKWMMVAKTSWVRYRTLGGALAVKKSVVIDCEVWTLKTWKIQFWTHRGKDTRKWFRKSDRLPSIDEKNLSSRISYRKTKARYYLNINVDSIQITNLDK